MRYIFKRYIDKRKNKIINDKIWGVSIFDKKDCTYPYLKTGYGGGIEITKEGSLQIHTDGKYRYLKGEASIKVLREMLMRLEEISSKNGNKTSEKKDE